MEKYQAAVAAGKAWAGKKPVPAESNARIAGIRKNLATARDRLAAAQARAAAATPAKVSPADPGTRLLPAKNGGYVQGWNLELAAARRQVLLAVELHDNPADAGALITMIATAAANCEQAGLRDQIRAWLADNGYASAANFAALEHLMLLVAVTGEAAQTGRGTGGRDLPAGWEKMAARLATPAGKKLYKRRAAQVEPAFAQLFTRFGRTPELPRPRRRSARRGQAPGHRAQPRQAPGLPAPAPRHRPRLTSSTATPPAVPPALRHARRGPQQATTARSRPPRPAATPPRPHHRPGHHRQRPPPPPPAPPKPDTAHGANQSRYSLSYDMDGTSTPYEAGFARDRRHQVSASQRVNRSGGRRDRGSDCVNRAGFSLAPPRLLRPGGPREMSPPQSEASA